MSSLDTLKICFSSQTTKASFEGLGVSDGASSLLPGGHIDVSTDILADKMCVTYFLRILPTNGMLPDVD